ncbi:uncharacterized protein LOC113344779, partial [Papaver somniferum]|uniref:uncharacterized protein LOC113344779 n=1 Tax=Papaver somniferum TaxID=3469 RepID=UPI000E6FED96
MVEYVGEADQKAFYDPCFDAAKLAKWLPADDGKPTLKVSFLGLITETSSVGIDRLMDDVKMRFREVLLKRGYAEDNESEQISDELARGGIKFAILQNVGERKSNDCKIDIVGVLASKGHPAFHLQLVYTSVSQFIDGAKVNIQDINKKLDDDFTSNEPNLRAIVLNRERRKDELISPKSTPLKYGNTSRNSGRRGVKLKKKPRSSGGGSGGPKNRARRLSSPEKPLLDHSYWLPKVIKDMVHRGIQDWDPHGLHLVMVQTV